MNEKEYKCLIAFEFSAQISFTSRIGDIFFPSGLGLCFSVGSVI